MCAQCKHRRRETIRNAAIDDLHEGEMAGVGKQVKGLGLDAGRIHHCPLDVFLGELGVRCRLGLLGHVLTGGGAMDRLLRPDHIGHSGAVSICIRNSEAVLGERSAIVHTAVSPSSSSW